MAIDPLQNVLLSGMTSAVNKTAQATSQNPHQDNFERRLSAAGSEAGGAGQIATNSLAVLRLAQIQMLQGLLADAPSAEDDKLFGALRLLPQTSPSAGQQRQVSQLYRQLQPSLRENPLAGRSEIEQMIEQVAEQVSLAPELIRSVVAAESDFQPQAVSHAGAQGLMQLMPETARELGVEDSFDPEQNLIGGSRYLKQLLDKYAGDLDKALAAYNWGQGNVDRKGLAEMPRETRNYLVKVKGLLAETGQS